MSDAVILPNGTIMHKVYSFAFEHEDNQVVVGFLKFGECERTGADHSFSSELRRDFGRMLLEQPPATTRNVWLPLPEHEYLQRLRQNNFVYVQYNICNLFAANRKIYISIKSETVDPPIVYSALFPREDF